MDERSYSMLCPVSA